MNNRQAIHNRLIEEFAYWDAPANEVKIRQFAEELSGISLDDLNASIKFFRRQPGRREMPRPGDYIAAIPDGHLSAHESWALVPKNEDDAVVWSEEMRLAWGAAYPQILEGNLTSAFFIYKEKYEKLVAEAKQNRTKPKWSLTESDKKSITEKVVVESVQNKRISFDLACKLFPYIESTSSYQQLALTYGGKEPLRINQTNQARIAQLIQPKEIK